MFGLGNAYFDGSRLEEFARLTSAFFEGTIKETDELLEKFYPGLSQRYDEYLVSRVDNDRYLTAVREYRKDKDFMKFEEVANNIHFYLQRSDYMNLLQSIEPEKRFLFSSMEYEVVGKFLQYDLYNGKKEISPKVVDFSWSMAPDDVKSVLTRLGAVTDVVSYPMRETVVDGQMKIFTDLYKLTQTMESQDYQSILIVGSAAQSMGGGKSYDMLQYMFKNSSVSMYDPHESNDYYVGKNNVSYSRHAEAYKYSEATLKYDLIQDDAFISVQHNRDLIDPEKWLLKTKNFSCKKLLGDEQYFKGYHGVRQVGKVSTKEERVYKNSPKIGTIRDSRFGNCSFCREMYYYSNYSYNDDFFAALAMLHSPSTRCSIRSRYVAPICCGDLDYKGKKMYCVLKVKDPVCMAFDPVGDLERVVNFSTVTDRTYVFSDIRNIQHYMYSAKVAVYDSGRYYINYEDKDIVDTDDYDEEIGGIKFRVIKGGLDMIKDSGDPPIFSPVKRLFQSVKVERGYPLLVATDRKDVQELYKGSGVVAPGDYALFWKLQRYYGHFYYVWDRGALGCVLMKSI